MGKGKIRVKDQRVTMQQVIEMIDRHGAALSQLMQEKQKTWVAVDQIYRKLKKTAAWPWPIGWFLLLHWERKAKAEFEVWQAQQQQAALADAQNVDLDEPKGATGIVTPMKPILDSGGNVVSMVDPS